MPELEQPKFPTTEKPHLSPNPHDLTTEYEDAGRGTPVIENTQPRVQGDYDTDQDARISVLEGKMAQAESDIDDLQAQTFVASFDGQNGAITTNGTLETNSSKVVGLTGQLPYLTVAPVADNASGFLKIVVLDAEPATYYNGYYYIITEAGE